MCCKCDSSVWCIMSKDFSPISSSLSLFCWLLLETLLHRNFLTSCNPICQFGRFFSWAIWIHFRKCLPVPISWNVLFDFFSQFQTSLWSYIKTELVLHWLRARHPVAVFLLCPPFAQHNVLKRLSFLQCMLWLSWWETRCLV